jgi:hypothetical protein
MSPSATENSPLLQNRATTNYNNVIIEDGDINGNISVITTDSPSPKSMDSHDDLLLTRLNGSPLMVVLIG